MCRSLRVVRCIALLGWILTLRPAVAVDYLTEIKPILAEKCYSCHGALKQESELRLETRALMVQGGDSGEVIVPGEPDQSLLIERITAADAERMPPPDQGSAIPADQVALIRQWISDGAEAPEEKVPLAPREHWSFQKIVRPEIPGGLGASHPIDALLEAKRREKGLTAQPPAPRSILIRRLYLDLIGLPPTAEQLDDTRPWNQIVDELLASPQHGERWARHWMDIWRYCDWYGLGQQLRFSQKHLWHWRDWIITSLNQDKGYDRMILEMLAGDELAPEDPSAIAGTGFLARNYYLFNRTTWLDSTIEHTSKAFLGLTLNCAKCHDHKYDPISQLDYYRLRAIFEPHQVRLDPIAGVTNFEEDGLPRVFDDHVDIETYLHVRGDPKSPDKEQAIEPGVPQLLASFAPPIEPIELPVVAYAPGARDYVQRDRLTAAKSKVQQAETALAAAKKKLDDQLAQEAALAKEDPSEAPSPQAASFEFVDEFDRPNPEAWTIVGDTWQYRDGAIHQTAATRDPQMIRFNGEVPRDFELTCRYTHTGGATYKSVTFRFDQSEDGKYANYVYTSAHAPGPKVQVSYTRGGNSIYPAEGRLGRKIELGKPYRLRFAVRDNLVNVWLDDEFMAAYRFPDRREGFLSLAGFDATVAFDAIEIRSLGEDFEMTDAPGPAGSSKSEVESAVAVAEAKLATAKAELRSLEATIAADEARFFGSSDSDSGELASAAARRQAEVEIALAEQQMVEKAADAKAVQAAKGKIEAARKRLAKIEQGEVAYQSIRGSKKALESPAHQETDYPPAYSPTSTGRRLALARWIVSPENPLTARVAVNHVWTRHFGTPLVESVFDFGLRANRPLHADVLDWLADEFMASGWSFRHLHRLIVTSDAYRMSSTSLGSDRTTADSDPTNAYYWRMNGRRMESQVVRDSLLHLAGQLDLSLGGPSLDPGADSVRRSLYFKHSRDQQDKFLEMFDDADELQCYRRSESIVPQQALALSNSSLAIKMSIHIEQRISKSVKAGDRVAFIESVFERLLGRLPSEAETDQCREYFETMSKLLAEQDASRSSNPSTADASQRIRHRFVQAILNHNDFITIR